MQYDKEFKLQALELSDEIGVKAAAEQLGIKYYTLADWRSQRKARGEGAFVGSGNKVMPLSELDDYVVVAEYETTTQFRGIEKLKAKEATVSGMETVQVIYTTSRNKEATPQCSTSNTTTLLWGIC